MASYRVVFTPETRDQLDTLRAYITTAADAEIASRFINRIVDYVATLAEFPNRGTLRDDLRTGLRTLTWRRRVTIAFMVEETDVVIIGIFYGGRDFETLLSDN